jgi:hypothetical protein
MRKRIITNRNHNYEAAYKKPHSGKLVWVSCFAISQAEANTTMDSYINNNYPNDGYTRYAGSLIIKEYENKAVKQEC